MDQSTETLFQRKFRGLVKWSARARASPRLKFAGEVFAALTISLGVLDAISTNLAIASGGVEVNAAMRWLQEMLGAAWFVPKLALHGLVASMLLWYPHRIVLMMFTPVMMVTGYVVANNLRIAGFWM